MTPIKAILSAIFISIAVVVLIITVVQILRNRKSKQTETFFSAGVPVVMNDGTVQFAYGGMN